MRILFFIRVKDNGEIKRGDFRQIISRLRQRGDETEIYDTATGLHYRVDSEGATSVISSAGFTSSAGLTSLAGLAGSNKVTLFFARLLALRSFSRKNRHCYDVAQFCYIREEFLIVARPLLKIASLNIATVFGADLGKRNIIKRIFTSFIYNSDIITVTGTNGRDLLKRHFSFGRIEGRVVQLPLPSLIMKEISASGLTKGEAKRRMGFREDDCIAVCGSVLSPNEQYEKWVPLLTKCIPEGGRIIFVFPFSYGDLGLLPAYRELIGSCIPAENFRVFEGWTDEGSTATLRIATDILINLRKTDQFAGIIIESLVTGASLITGDWLRYNYFQEKSIWHYRIGEFGELPEVFGRAFSDRLKQAVSAKLQENVREISEDFSYEKSISRWDLFYEEVRQKVSDEKVK